MSPSSSWLSAPKFASVAVGFALAALNLSSQRPKVLAPHVPVPPAVPASQMRPMAAGQARSLVGGLWMTDANFKSSIFLKNLVETSAVTVTPVLHLSNGTEYILNHVTLAPSDTAIVDINAALQAQGIAPYATLQGYVEVRYTWPWDPVCVTVRDLDVAHSLIFTYGLQPSTPAPPVSGSQVPVQTPTVASQTLVGMWWMQEKDVTGFVALANTTSAAITATVQLTDNAGAPYSTHTVTISPQGMKLVELPEVGSVSAPAGGIQVTYNGPPSGLIANGGLEEMCIRDSLIGVEGALDGVELAAKLAEALQKFDLLSVEVCHGCSPVDNTHGGYGTKTPAYPMGV